MTLACSSQPHKSSLTFNLFTADCLLFYIWPHYKSAKKKSSKGLKCKHFFFFYFSSQLTGTCYLLSVWNWFHLYLRYFLYKQALQRLGVNLMLCLRHRNSSYSVRLSSHALDLTHHSSNYLQNLILCILLLMLLSLHTVFCFAVCIQHMLLKILCGNLVLKFWKHVTKT